nr:hypothetical protein [uncultured Roseateles sp.]
MTLPHAYDVSALERQFGPDAQLLMTEWRPKVLLSREQAFDGYVAALERLGDLDALGLMVLEAFSARIEGKDAETCDWIKQIYRLMMQLGEGLLARGLARPLSELIDERLASRLSCEGLQYWSPANHFSGALAVISRMHWHLADLPFEATTEAQRQQVTRAVLDGDYGWDLKFALDPIRVPAQQDAPLTNTAGEMVHIHLRLFVWGWNMLRSYRRHPDYPPDAVFEGADLTARAIACPA